MAIRVGTHWCMPQRFPFGSIHLDTVLPVLGLMAFTIGLLSIASDSNQPPGAFWLSGGSAAGLMASQMADLTSSQLGERSWLPVVAGSFVFIFASNWAGALLPIELIRVPQTELHAPTADVNVTAGLALATSHAYFYAGFQTRSFGYLERYVSPVAYLLPINLLEDFSKPLSLSFRLLGNIMADELTIAVLSSLVAFIVPVAVM
jgi:F0F1-type ATP synthase membrane subunit a